MNYLFKIATILLTLHIVSCGDVIDKSSTSLSSVGTCPWNSIEDILLTEVSNLNEESDPPTFNLEQVETLLTVDQVNDDFACLKVLFETTYIGPEYYPESSLYEKLESARQNILEPITNIQLMTKMFDIHGSEPDLHLSYQHGETELRFQRAKVYYLATGSSDTISSCEGLKKVFALEGGELVHKWVGQFLDEPSPMQVWCNLTNGTNVELPLIAAKDSVVDRIGSEFQVIEKPEYYLVVVPIMDGVTEEKRNFLNKILSDPVDKPILIDIRGNFGGETDFAIELGRALQATSDMIPTNSKTKEKIGLISSAAMANRGLSNWASGDGDIQFWRDVALSYGNWVEFLQEQGFGFLDFNLEEKENGYIAGLRAASFSAPVVLLTDKHCASGCENFFTALEGIDHLKIVGLPSMGALHVSNAGKVYLPNSKIAVSLGRLSHEYTVEIPEAYGYEPDVYLFEDDPTKALSMVAEKFILHVQ